jgi:hypothetical protein
VVETSRWLGPGSNDIEVIIEIDGDISYIRETWGYSIIARVNVPSSTFGSGTGTPPSL